MLILYLLREYISSSVKWKPEYLSSCFLLKCKWNHACNSLVWYATIFSLWSSITYFSYHSIMSFSEFLEAEFLNGTFLCHFFFLICTESLLRLFPMFPGLESILFPIVNIYVLDFILNRKAVILTLFSHFLYFWCSGIWDRRDCCSRAS